MQDSMLSTQAIKTIQIFYYSSPNHIFVNTALIELLNVKYVPQNIHIKTTQIPQPTHHNFGQAPFLCVNHSHIIKRTQIWDFITLVLNIDLSRKFEFLSVVYLTEEISQVANIFSEYDQNPYFVFISPWRKYKRHHELQNRKHWFRDNSLFSSSADDSLNKEYFIYKVNSLGALMAEYSKEYATKPQYLKIYKILTYAFLKHLKIVQNTLYLVVCEIEMLKNIENQIQERINRQMDRQVGQNQVNAERMPMRNIMFTNVHLKYLNENYEQKNKVQEPNVEYTNPREKLNQYIFKPVITTLMFVLAMFAFK